MCQDENGRPAGIVWAPEGSRAAAVLKEMKIVNDARREKLPKVGGFKKLRSALSLVFYADNGKPPSGAMILMPERYSRTYSDKPHLNPSGVIIVSIGERLPKKRIHEAAGAMLALLERVQKAQADERAKSKTEKVPV